MRLGQLARQVGISQKEIVSFLIKEKNIELKVHPNVKVEDELANLVIETYTRIEEPEATEKIIESIPEDSTGIDDDKSASKDVEPETTEVKEYVQGEEFIRPEGPIEKVETEIPQLEGIKVVGKIDLPQFHKEEPAPDKDPENSPENPTDETQEENDETIVLPNATPLFNKRPTRKPRKEKTKPVKAKKRVISEDDRKKKELERTERQRLAMKKAKKEEARKKHLELVKSYENKQKPKSNPKKNTKSVAIEELKNAASQTSLGHQVSNSPNKPKKEPKTFIGKIWRWMNTE